MKEEYKALQLVNNKEKHRFELMVNNNTAIIEYINSPSAIYLTHTQQLFLVSTYHQLHTRHRQQNLGWLYTAHAM
jgi:hypothetical protein